MKPIAGKSHQICQSEEVNDPFGDGVTTLRQGPRRAYRSQREMRNITRLSSLAENEQTPAPFHKNNVGQIVVGANKQLPDLQSPPGISQPPQISAGTSYGPVGLQCTKTKQLPPRDVSQYKTLRKLLEEKQQTPAPFHKKNLDQKVYGPKKHLPDLQSPPGSSQPRQISAGTSSDPDGLQYTKIERFPPRDVSQYKMLRKLLKEEMQTPAPVRKKNFDQNVNDSNKHLPDLQSPSGPSQPLQISAGRSYDPDGLQITWTESLPPQKGLSSAYRSQWELQKDASFPSSAEKKQTPSPFHKKHLDQKVDDSNKQLPVLLSPPGPNQTLQFSAGHSFCPGGLQVTWNEQLPPQEGLKSAHVEYIPEHTEANVLTVTWISNVECASRISHHLVQFCCWQNHTKEYKEKTQTLFKNNQTANEQAVKITDELVQNMDYFFGTHLIQDLLNVDVKDFNMQEMLCLISQRVSITAQSLSVNEVCIKLHDMIRCCHGLCVTQHTLEFFNHIEAAEEALKKRPVDTQTRQLIEQIEWFFMIQKSIDGGSNVFC